MKGIDIKGRLRDIFTRISDIDTQVDGLMVAVSFYNQANSTVNGETIYFEFDALGASIRDIQVAFYLPLHATATFTPRYYRTRPNDLITFTLEVIPALAVIATPAAAYIYRYSLGDLAQGLQSRFVIHQDNNAGAVSIDAAASALMEV